MSYAWQAKKQAALRVGLTHPHPLVDTLIAHYTMRKSAKDSSWRHVAFVHCDPQP